ncbi:hypothetical protein DSCA_54550 [Desulfosarcina alkanivorans]|uniref:Uncharacterized protein n=1 Tax=Desulfosarcina alkanivorans TaxID=571177 RepID=A0A5K7YT02_9BACT|nr:hypothetical protein DSCA_54550 [Desulfosarcina alkanivorans]
MCFFKKPTYMDTIALSIEFAGFPLGQSVKLCEYAQKLDLNQEKIKTPGTGPVAP